MATTRLEHWRLTRVKGDWCAVGLAGGEPFRTAPIVAYECDGMVAVTATGRRIEFGMPTSVELVFADEIGNEA